MITRHNVALAVLGTARPGQRARSRRRASAAFERGADPAAALLAFVQGEDEPVPVPPAGIPTVILHGRNDAILTADDAAALADHYEAPLYVVRSGHELPWGVERQVAERVAAVVGHRRGWGCTRGRGSAGAAWGVRLAWAAAMLTVIAIAGLIAASTITVPYYAIRPGVARQTNDLVVVPDNKRITPTGQVLFVTVGVQRLRALQYVLAKRDPDVDVVPEEAILGKADPKQYEQRSTQAMVDSKETAAVVVLERLCLPVKEKGTGARIEEVAAGSPADKAGLKAEDTITAVGGRPVATAADALEPLRAAKPQASVSLTVVGPAEADAPRTVEATLGTNPTDAAAATSASCCGRGRRTSTCRSTSRSRAAGWAGRPQGWRSPSPCSTSSPPAEAHRRRKGGGHGHDRARRLGGSRRRCAPEGRRGAAQRSEAVPRPERRAEGGEGQDRLVGRGRAGRHARTGARRPEGARWGPIGHTDLLSGFVMARAVRSGLHAT